MSALIGIFCALAVVIGAALCDGDPISALYSTTALIIVFGGTMTALLTQFGFKHVVTGLARFMWLVKPPLVDLPDFIEKAARWSNLCRTQGSLALEKELPAITDEFQRQALQLIVDNASEEDLQYTLEVLAQNATHEDEISGEMWEAAGGYLPTIGVMGAVLGLIHVMMRLDHPEELGAGVATAFVATIYGVGAANLIFLPVGTRLSGLAKLRERERQLVIQGFMLIKEGKSGLMIKQTLHSFLTGHAKGKEKTVIAEPPIDAIGEAA
jgi:chemotaxis protein MotA